MLTLTNISIAFGAYGSAHINLGGDGNYLTIKLTDEDKARFQQLGMEIFLARQPEMAKAVAEAKIEALPAPDAVEGEFTEVTF